MMNNVIVKAVLVEEYATYIVVLLQELRRFRSSLSGLGLEANNAGIVNSKVNFAWCSHVAVQLGCSS